MSHIRDCVMNCLAAGAFASMALSCIPAAGAATETVVYSFCSQNSCSDGVGPYAGMIDIKGKLYGTTAGQYGNAYSFDPKTGTETNLHDFSGLDGIDPYGGLIDIKGTLYGTTQQGGGYAFGTMFSIDPKTDAETVLHSFGYGTDGYGPYAAVVDVKGTLYGTTVNGGSSKLGVVFSLDPKTGTETVLHSFGNSPDGAEPYAGLIHLKGSLYGTTESGGTYGYGAVFSIDPTTGAEAVLYSFGRSADGQKPVASLINVKGMLYGTTNAGGTYGYGTVFAIDPTTGSETVLHSFGDAILDGANPYAGLIDVKGTLYGTTETGGYGNGTVFSIDRKTGNETVLYAFRGITDGGDPYGKVIDVEGTLYGTTYGGGANYSGVIFALRP